MKKVCILIILSAFIFIQGYAQESLPQLKRKAEMHFRNSEWKEALPAYTLILSSPETDVSLYVNAIIVSLELDTFPTAVKFVDNALSNQISLDTLLVKTDIQTRLLNISHRFEELLLGLKQEIPDLSPRINQYLCQHYKFTHQYAKHVDILHEMIDKSPRNIPLIREIAFALYNNGDTDNALAHFEEVLIYDPTDRESILFLGNYYYIKGKQKMNRLYEDYQNIIAPTRMQYAQYKQTQQEIKNNELELASKYLNQANQMKSTNAIRDILYDIYTLSSDAEKAESIKKRSK
ncbi:MAG: hypothetical protein IJ338_08640 [Bacteroidaceae bacterium]|nr:hypothetical protein [Bacteroidaceae bacterium]